MIVSEQSNMLSDAEKIAGIFQMARGTWFGELGLQPLPLGLIGNFSQILS